MYFLPFPTPPFYLHQYQGRKEIYKRIPVISQLVLSEIVFSTLVSFKINFKNHPDRFGKITTCLEIWTISMILSDA